MSGRFGTGSRHDRDLLAEVRPDGWSNPEPAPRYHLVVVGAGTAGLVSAAGAAGLGARVALVERHLMGGDCLNVGCVPSKALLASARAAAEARRGRELGVPASVGTADFPAVMERLRALRAELAPTDGAARFRGLGVDVFFGAARFVARDALEVGGARLSFARAVVATGGRPAVPEVPGLAAAGFRTNETIFDLEALPRRLAVVGGGPIGCELAQAFARLGSRVTLLQRAPRLLPRDDPDASELIATTFRAEEIDVRLGATLAEVSRDGAVRRLRLSDGAAIEADEILVATGRLPDVEELGLEAAGVETRREGVVVDDFLRTTNRRIFAAGDVALAAKFTHAADAAARVVIQNALFAGRKRFSAVVVPWSTYTDPEVAHVGLGAAEAAARGAAVATLTVPFDEVDRARLEGDPRGFLRVHAEAASGRVLGATVVGRHAGDLVAELATAIAGRMGLADLAAVVHPYPTRAEAVRKAGDAWNRRRLTPRTRRLLGAWLRLRFGRLS